MYGWELIILCIGIYIYIYICKYAYIYTYIYIIYNIYTYIPLGALGCAFAPRSIVYPFLCAFRFLLGVGVGGDYPISAIIAAEFAPTKMRGRMIAMVFAMQGVGILLGAVVAIGTLKIFQSQIESDISKLDIVWRILAAGISFPLIISFISYSNIFYHAYLIFLFFLYVYIYIYMYVFSLISISISLSLSHTHTYIYYIYIYSLFLSLQWVYYQLWLLFILEDK